MINLKLTPSELYKIQDKFSREACEWIVNFYDECCDTTQPMSLGDLLLSFSEIPTVDVTDYELDNDLVIAEMNNGNSLILN